jgi:hypothetical protein
LSIKKHGQNYFDNKVPEGRKLSGVEQAEEARRISLCSLQLELENKIKDKYSVFPPDLLEKLPVDRLKDLMLRYEGPTSDPNERTKAGRVTRIINAGKLFFFETLHHCSFCCM